MSLALKATRAIVARRDLQGLQDQPVLLVQVHQQRRKSWRHHLGLEHRDLVNPRGTASRTEVRVDRWQHPPIPAACSTSCSKRRVNTALRASALVRGAYLGKRTRVHRTKLITDAKHYIKHLGARAYKPVLGNGLVTSEGEFWHRQRNPGATSIRCAKVGSPSLFRLRDWVHM